MRKKTLSLITTILITFSIFPLNILTIPVSAREWNYEEIYEHNKKVYNSKRTDKYILDYYTQPSDMITSVVVQSDRKKLLS